MGRALEIRDDLTAEELRALAARERSDRAARRLLAIANALDGMSRADAATAAGMERQALRDAVIRYDAEGPEGVRDRPLPGRPPALSEAELVLLFDRVFRGPDPETDGVSAWTLPDLCRWIEARFTSVSRRPMSCSRGDVDELGRVAPLRREERLEPEVRTRRVAGPDRRWTVMSFTVARRRSRD